MTCRLFGAKPLSEPMLPYCRLDPKEHISVKFIYNWKVFIQGNALENIVCEIVAILSVCGKHPPVACFTKEVNPWLAKRPLKTNGRLANHGLTSLAKQATGLIE